MKGKSKFQDGIKFADMDDFWEHLPEDQKAITRYLRSLVLECLPNAKEKLTYNVPYYYINRRVCMIWPAAVPWGGIKTGVLFGFCQGNIFTDETDFFKGNITKVVRYKIFHSVAEAQECEDLLKTYLFIAAETDEQFRKIKH